MPRRTNIPKGAEDAVAKFREFHRLEPTKIGLMPELEIPARIRRAGVAKWVTYRSAKIDPDTLTKPKKPVDYIHEHDAGVHLYRPDGELDTDVPKWIRSAAALTKLGLCLGYAYADPAHQDPIEGIGKAPLPELYCTPDGKALLVVQDKREILAMMWGGALGVFARGIDG